jgi:hypothetical protein
VPEATVLLGGRYRLDRLIERGEIAEVWEATDEVLARRVAVKVLHDPQPGAVLAAARLGHPGIVRIYDAHVDGDTAFVVMELARGTTVRELMAARGGRLSPRMAVAIAAQVADALDHAHSRGVVHGAVDTANVVCDGDRAKVGDFGVVGTVPDDPRADVFALGSVLYEMVCGRRPSTSPAQPALRPRQVVAGVPRELEAAILRAMAPDPGDRFATAAALRDALTAIDLDDDAVPLVTADDDTPPAGMLAPSFRETERSWLVPALAILLVAAALVVVGIVFAGTDVGRDLLHRNRATTPPPTAAPPAPLGIAGVSAFDPLGDGDEHDGEAADVTDGDPSTTWDTSTYSSADFGRLKSGVGLVVRLDEPGALRRVEVQAPAHGWRADVYVADAPSPAFPGGWGQPVATLDGSHDLVAADLPAGTRGGAVLVWLTSLPRDGGSYRAVIGEVRVLG